MTAAVELLQNIVELAFQYSFSVQIKIIEEEFVISGILSRLFLRKIPVISACRERFENTGLNRTRYPNLGTGCVRTIINKILPSRYLEDNKGFENSSNRGHG